MNEAVRQAYLKDCEIGLKRWNRTIERAGFDFRLQLPSTRFRRAIGAWANQAVDLSGTPISSESYERQLAGWLPSGADRIFVKSLMRRVVEPGKIAGWIAPPERGINNLAVDYEYVKLS
jgi:benzoyl-CoA 2,3-epoxidase subunit B